MSCIRKPLSYTTRQISLSQGQTESMEWVSVKASNKGENQKRGRRPEEACFL